MNFVNPAWRPLTIADFAQIADDLGVDLAAVRAVAKVEALGSGYLKSNRPIILFESRLFNNFTDGKYLDSHPHLATRAWVRNYLGGEREYERLEEAANLNWEAAMRSASWGLFQILGDNFHLCDFGSVEAYVNSVVHNGERSHLEHFAAFIANQPHIHNPLVALDWHRFARYYNGPGYQKNRYAARMAEAYEQFKGD